MSLAWLKMRLMIIDVLYRNEPTILERQPRVMTYLALPCLPNHRGKMKRTTHLTFLLTTYPYTRPLSNPPGSDPHFGRNPSLTLYASLSTAFCTSSRL